jgi:hypothetical protein
VTPSCSMRAMLVEKPICHDIRDVRELVGFAEKQKVYLGCNLNHYFTPPAEKAKQYVDNGDIGELVYCLAKMGFNGGEPNYSPAGSPKIKGHPYFHMKAFLTHPLSDALFLRRYYAHPDVLRSTGAPQELRRCDGIHQQHSRQVCKRRRRVSAQSKRRCGLRLGRLVEPRDGGHPRHILH